MSLEEKIQEAEKRRDPPSEDSSVETKSTMRRAVQRFLPSRSQVQGSSNSIRKSFKFDSINLIEDFYINLDEPHKAFRPGESIKGTIVLDLKKNITDINITMTLIGLIKIKQTSNTTTVRSKPNLLFKHTTVIYGEDTNKENEEADTEQHNEDDIEDEQHITLSGLSKGEHRFPFSIKLPRKNIYTSITFEKGSISYSFRASINHNKTSPLSSMASSPASLQSQSPGSIIPYPKNSIQHCDKNLQIIVPINVAKIPKPSTKVAILKPSDKKLKKTVSSTSTVNSNVTQFTVASDNSMDSMNNQSLSQNQTQNGNTPQVRLFVDITESGFLRGETVPLKIRLHHYKPIQSSSGIIVTLIRICRVDNGPEAPIQSFRKDLAQTIAPLYIDPETLTAELSTSLKVPVDAFPTIIGSDLVTFQYYIEVLANISSKNLIANPGASQSSKNSKNKFSHSIVFNTETPQEREMLRSEQGVLNVDKLKRIKNFLGLNTEIIVGTERNYKRAQIGKKTVVGNALYGANGTNNGTNGNCNTNVSGASSYNGESPVHLDSDNSIMEGFSQTSISPLSINGNSNGTSTANNNISVVSTGEEIFVPPQDPNLSEKEQMRLREQALLPSEPFIPDDFAPAPSYASAAGTSNQMDSALTGPISSSIDTVNTDTTTTMNTQTQSHYMNGGSTDKAELERQRLQQLESDPPEFDYVPEYNPAGQDSVVEGQSNDQNGGGSSEIETLKETSV